MAARAAARGVPFIVLHTHAPAHVLAERVAQRHATGCDASEADLDVLASQRRTASPLSDAERALTIDVDTASDPDPGAIASALIALIARAP